MVFNLHLCSIDCGSLKLSGHGGGAIRLSLVHDEERKQMVPFPRSWILVTKCASVAVCLPNNEIKANLNTPFSTRMFDLFSKSPNEPHRNQVPPRLLQRTPETDFVQGGKMP